MNGRTRPTRGSTVLAETPCLAELTRLLVMACVALGGCVTADHDYPRTPSAAFEDTQETRLGRDIAALPQVQAGESGFYLLEDGIDALAVRLMMADDAERSIDAQYYLINNDVAGHLFVNSLLDAADRGVRVRLLLDDIYASEYDDGLRALDAHPRVEVRVFNPFARGLGSKLDSLLSFRRVNRRMHNKSFTVDNQATVIGGRNIGSEYFAGREGVNFGDLDVFAVGPVVREVSNMFDLYWNYEASLPAPAVVGTSEDPPGEQRELRDFLAAAMESARSTPYGQALDSTILDVATRENVLTWCPYDLVYDAPQKADHGRAEQAGSIASSLAAAIEGAQEQVLIVTPYFVPLETGRAFLARVHERGVRVRVVTNSLAANNHTAVHSGYAPTRKTLLEMGIELYEVRPDAEVAGVDRVGYERTRATLHTKAFAVDRSRLFLGSFNFDPRSAYINTEMGIILDAPELVADVLEDVDAGLPRVTYHVTLDRWGRLRWTTLEDGEEVSYNTEPQAGLWRRLLTDLMRMLPIKGQL